MCARLLVDLQNDVSLGGALAVGDGGEVVAVANALMPQFEPWVLRQDHHPAGHSSFVEDGCRALDLDAGDGTEALLEMMSAGALLVKSVELLGD